MKLTIIGAAGVRTPLIIDEIINRQDRIGITELCLMDIDSERLELIAAVTAAGESSNRLRFSINRTTDAVIALTGADYVITTFRVGGIESRIIDERVPLDLGIIGQETTGPGGFAMGLRSIPVLANYARLMQEYCPKAWLINFANPSGMMAEALHNYIHFDKAIGICDGPTSVINVVSQVLQIPVNEIYAEYFGLNHLGWFKSINTGQKDRQPELIQMLVSAGGVPGLDIDPNIIASLKMIPNEYLYYYYHSRQAVANILRSGLTRGESIAVMNNELFSRLRELRKTEDFSSLRKVHHDYIHNRSKSYMVNETGHDKSDLDKLIESSEIGYAELALDLIESLTGGKSSRLILNVPNRGAITGMRQSDIVEIPTFVTKNSILPVAIGEVPDHCLGLMKQIKAYELLTIEAALEGSYNKAINALTIHPLVGDYQLSKMIVDGYLQRHGSYFPKLS
jgi:6-phospho-beta-glucosidase